jgi:hypothetical protein
VEPEYRLDTIRARTRRQHPRRGWFAAGGAVLAAASVVTAVSIVDDDGPRRRVDPAGPEATVPTAVYFIGPTPAGPRLYREYQQLPQDPLAALRAITTEGGPDDPDYRTLWPAGMFASVEVTGTHIRIGVVSAEEPEIDGSEPIWDLALQQVVYTAQAATGAELPVTFVAPEPSDTTYIPEVQRAAQNDVLAPMSISDPVEGLRVTDSFIARGRANSHEANVLWELRAADGTPVKDGFTTAEGTVTHLFPWETDRIDVSDLDPGRYEFVAMTEDPSGGAEGFGSFTDTRTIVVE